MRKRDAERLAKKFVAEYYPYHSEHWNFDICPERAVPGGAKSWSFGLTPDEEHPDYEPYLTFTGYVHADGTVEGLY